MASGLKDLWSKVIKTVCDKRQNVLQKEEVKLKRMIDIHNQRGIIQVETQLVTKIRTNFIVTNIQHEKDRQNGKIGNPVSLKCNRLFIGGNCVNCGCFGEHIWWDGPAKDKPKCKKDLK